MKKKLEVMILILLAAGLTAGMSQLSAMNLGGAPAEIDTPVPTTAPAAVSTPGTHHRHHHVQSRTSTNTIVATPPAMIKAAPIATPQPITVSPLH